MPYLGKLPTSGAFQKLDAISTVNDQAAYTMQIGGVNFSPESANNMLVTVNGILQSPTTNYTINGSTITFTSALVTGDVINSILILGDVLNVGTPSDATVTNAKTNFVSTSSAAGLSIKGDGTTDGTVQLNCSQNSHGVKIASPAHSAGQGYTIKLPTENIAADKIMKVASITGSGTSAVGQLSFVDTPSGSHTLLETTTVSSSTAAVEFDSMNTRGYKVYKLSVIQARPVTDNVKPMIRVAGADGTIDTGNIYNRAAKGLSSTGSDLDNGQVYGSSSAFLVFGGSVDVGNAAHESFSFEMYMMGADSATANTTFHATGTSQGSDYCTCIVSGCNVFEAAISTKLQFSMNSGSIAGGIFKLYGVS